MVVAASRDVGLLWNELSVGGRGSGPGVSFWGSGLHHGRPAGVVGLLVIPVCTRIRVDSQR